MESERTANCADAAAGGPAAGDAVGDLRTAAPPRLVWHLQNLCTGQVYVAASSRRITVASPVRFDFFSLVPMYLPPPPPLRKLFILTQSFSILPTQLFVLF